MRAALIILVGLAIAFGSVLAGRTVAKRPDAGAVLFLLLWLSFCYFDYTRGVAAGYQPSEEMRIHALLFTLPALGAWLAFRLLR